MILSSKNLQVSFVAILLAVAACTKQPSNKSESGGSGGSTGSENSGEFTTDCGVVFGGDLSNPVSRGEGTRVRVKTVVGANLLIVEPQGENAGPAQIVKLHGVSAGNGTRKEQAMNLLDSMTNGELYYYQADESCTVPVDGGGQGTIGQLITPDGKSLTEELIKSGAAAVDTSDPCGGDKLAACLTALKGTEVKTMGEVHKFLWKPLSDTKGNIAVIHEVHCNTEVFINGQSTKYAGAGNGRCGTFAASRAGCAYGNNIKVEVIDKTSGWPYTYKGKPYITVPSGCSRFEIQ